VNTEYQQSILYNIPKNKNLVS